MKSDMSSGVAEAAAAAAPFEEPFEEPPEENPEKNPNELPAASPEEGLSGGSLSALGAPRHLEPHPHPAPLEVGAGVATTSVALVFWASRYFSVVAPLLQYFILCHTPSKQKDENALSPGDKQQQVTQTPGLCFLHGALGLWGFQGFGVWGLLLLCLCHQEVGERDVESREDDVGQYEEGDVVVKITPAAHIGRHVEGVHECESEDA